MRIHFRSMTLSALLVFSLIMGFSKNVFAIGTLIKAPDRVDMVHDNTRNILYVTSGDSVLRYSLSTNSFLPPLELSGDLKGIDISPDDNMLAVADHNLFGFHLVDLKTEQSKRVIYKAPAERGSFSVAFNGNNMLLVSTSSTFYGGSGSLKQYDIATGAFTAPAEIGLDAVLSASADGSVIGFTGSSPYSSSFGRVRTADGYILKNGAGGRVFEIGANRNGTQYAIRTYDGTHLADSDLSAFAIIGQYMRGQPVGVAYNPVKDVVYFPWAETSQVYAFDTNTLRKIASYDFESGFGFGGNNVYEVGRAKVSKDGKYLFVTVNDGIRYIDLTLVDSEKPKALTSSDSNIRVMRLK